MRSSDYICHCPADWMGHNCQSKKNNVNMPKMNNMFRVDGNSIGQCFAPSMFNVVNNIVQHCYTDCGLTQA